ncbi:MAG: helix-turn-helix transcriptional regulator [Sulfurospirillum sp.]|nr:helix-turn-helix transcriptional regulator [Sulfurospirillum sp.]
MKKINSTDELGLEIQKIRKEQKMSRKSLARLAGVSERTISRLENGELIDVGITKIFFILDILNRAIEITSSSRILTLDELNQGKTY